MKRGLWIFFQLLVLVGLVWLFFNYQNVIDYFALTDFQPSAQIQSIAQADTLTPRGQQLFYMTHPQVFDRSTFASHCPKPEAGINVLGCYEQAPFSSGRIALFGISNPQLADEIDVTAAHETLHSAYAHLKPWEQQDVKKMIDHALTQIPQNQLSDVVKNYIKEGNYNELHSHLGTEIINLPPDLEAYYARYFTDRKKIAAIHQSNEALFNQCDTQEGTLKKQIDADQSSLNASQAELDAMHSKMQQELSAGQIQQYNAQVPAYNAAVVAHNALLSTFNSLVNQYNQLIGVCNTLTNSLNSAPPIHSVIKSR